MWYNPPQYTPTHIRTTIVGTWLTARSPETWRVPDRSRGRHVQRITVRGSKLYYFDRPIAAFRNGWLLLNKNPKLRGPARSVARHVRWSHGVVPAVLVTNLNARPVTHRQEFIEHVHTLGWKLVRAQRLVCKRSSTFAYDLGTQPESIEHFKNWWDQVNQFCRDFQLPLPELDPQLRDRLTALRIAQRLNPEEQLSPF